MNINNPGTWVASGALALGMMGSAVMIGNEDAEMRDKKVCQLLADGETVSAEKMPKMTVLGDAQLVAFSGKDIADQIEKCRELGVEATRGQVAASVRATYMSGENNVPQSMVIDALGTLETK